MRPKTIYLQSYNVFAEVLRYDWACGISCVMTVAEFNASKELRTFGSFVREDDDFYGVFASPDGPIFFKNQTAFAGSLGKVRIEIDPEGTSGANGLAIYNNGAALIKGSYRERSVIGANPYDTSKEDVDFFAMLAAGAKNEQFFINYTRAWNS